MTETQVSEKTKLLKQIARRELVLHHSETGDPTGFVWGVASVQVQVGTGSYTIPFTSSMSTLIQDLRGEGREPSSGPIG